MAEHRTLAAGQGWRLRLIALFEALKGVLALALGFGVVTTLGEPLTEAVQEFVLGLHLDPSQRFTDALIVWTHGIRPGATWLLIASALAYAGIRFAEAYGLWRDRRWAAWVAALSGGVYLPLEAYELTKGFHGYASWPHSRTSRSSRTWRRCCGGHADIRCPRPRPTFDLDEEDSSGRVANAIVSLRSIAVPPLALSRRDSSEKRSERTSIPAAATTVIGSAAGVG